MVSTRSHPTAFSPPDQSAPPAAVASSTPNTRSRRSRGRSTASPGPASSSALPTAANATTNNDLVPRTAAATTTTTTTKATPPPGRWTHTPSRTTLAWLALSLPLVAWDTLYMLLRPLTMPGGALHAPLWSPYALYGAVDGTYGFAGWESRDGFGPAQASLNLVETAMYVVYLALVLRGAEGEVDDGPGGARRVWVRGGRTAALAVVVGFAASVMTLSKTVLYWLVEWWNGYQNIGHNDALTLITLWVVPNGLWIIFPSYMTYIFGSEIIQGLESASAVADIKKGQ